MESIGIDVHKKQSSISIRTERSRFAAMLGGRPRARVLIEASTESEWVTQCLEGLGMRGSWRTRTTRRCTDSAIGG